MTKVEVCYTGKYDLPRYAHVGDAGCDVYAHLDNINPKFMFDAEVENNELIIEPNGRALVPTGLYVAIPYGYEIQVRSRSGLALKEGVHVLNSPGTIDHQYRNEIGVILMNSSNKTVVIKDGERIAQLVLNKIEFIDWDLVTFLSHDSTDRGLGGFGSSGK